MSYITLAFPYKCRNRGSRTQRMLDVRGAGGEAIDPTIGAIRPKTLWTLLTRKDPIRRDARRDPGTEPSPGRPGLDTSVLAKE